MKILITGTAGFIGMHTVRLLAERGDEIVGIDSINDYYDVALKYDRLAETGIEAERITAGDLTLSTRYPNYRFGQMDLQDKERLDRLFRQERFECVCNLAAQAGVRYSLQNPYAYLDSNIYGFLNILECCRHHGIAHLVYASSSSVYGINDKIPFSEEDKVSRPASLYAATKASNELMAHAYSHLYGIPATGLRFFTVYGPWGRPDMAPMLFADSISSRKPIRVFNNGRMYRDFTYIDDIICGLVKVIDKAPAGDETSKIYNIGCSDPVDLMEFIRILEDAIGNRAILEMMPMQPGDVYRTYADTSALERDFGFKPSIGLKEGIGRFIQWYKSYK